MTRLATAFAAALVALLAAAAPAAAEPVGEVVSLEAGTDPIQLTYSARDKGKSVNLAPGGFTVTLTQGAVTETVKPAIGGVDDLRNVRRSAVIALDVSGSMNEDPGRMPAAKKAARTFLDAVPEDVEVGLVIFGDPAETLIEPTTDRGPIRARIQELQPIRGADTALYQAVMISAGLTRGDSSRSIVLLTDGENEDETPPSVEEPGPVKEALKGVKLTAVSVAPGIGDLNDIALPDSNIVRVTDTALDRTLRTTFANEADVLANQVPLSVSLPKDIVSGRVGTLSVTATTTSGQKLAPVTYEGRLLGPAAAPKPPVVAAAGRPDPRLSAVTTPIVIGAIGLLFVAFLVLLATATGAFGGAGGGQSEVVRRLSVYTFTGRDMRRTAVAEQTTALGSSSLARTAVDVADRITRNRNIDRPLDARLDAAGLPLRAGEWVVLHAGSAVAGTLLFLLIGAGRIVPALIGFMLGVVGPWVFLTMRKSRRERTFLRQLPDTLQLLAGSLRTGYSLPQAMDTVVREARPPISTEFNRALIEARLGVPPEDALDGIADRTGSRDFSWIVLAIRIQRDVGGNLAELLGSVADTLRERERLRRQVTSLSAEGRLSGIILAALPLLFTVYLMLVQPDYLTPMFTTTLGILMLLAGAALLAVGGFWMALIVKVKV